MASAGLNGLEPPTKNKRAENGSKGNGYLDANGRFNGKAGPGRRPGRPNKTTGILKEAILIAASNAGDDIARRRIAEALASDGEIIEVNGGLVGYLEEIALRAPQSFVPLLGKVLPLSLWSEWTRAGRQTELRRKGCGWR